MLSHKKRKKGPRNNFSDREHPSIVKKHLLRKAKLFHLPRFEGGITELFRPGFSKT